MLCKPINRCSQVYSCFPSLSGWSASIARSWQGCRRWQRFVYLWSRDDFQFWLTKWLLRWGFTDVLHLCNSSKLISKIRTITGAVVNVLPFPLPARLIRFVAAVGWARPELYLISSIRNGISSFARLPEIRLNQGLSHLQEDLEMGCGIRKFWTASNSMI